ncbi:MAG: hypothetical protein LBG84_01420 [Treponema sp.]|jgi:hypothetical protein|nr:hypothetical protein [Treponema sp.]
MKFKIRSVILIALFFPFAFISCKSTATPGQAGLSASSQEVSLESLAAAREEAVAAGVPEVVPDRFAQADALADTARQKLDNRDKKGFLKDAREAQDRYRILTTIAQARAKQEEADENDFFPLDEDSYKLAAEAGNNAVDLYDAGSLPAAEKSAVSALDQFTQVLKNGWTAKVEDTAAAARERRQASLDAKADVALRRDFEAADDIYEKAHVALRAEEYSSAAKLFEQSSQLFAQVRDAAVEKRARAQAALQRAEEKVADSGKKAQEADDYIGGGE